jgi:hypothetical protein
MARPRTLSDSAVFAAILRMIAAEGEKAIAFSSVARATGLAGASLVQRYGALPAMVEAALAWGWDELDAQVTAVEAEVAAADKGPQALLKALGERSGSLPMAALLASSLRYARLRLRAAAWRARIEALLAARTHDGERAAMLFALWQGQVLWDGMSERGFRLKDAWKRLA